MPAAGLFRELGIFERRSGDADQYGNPNTAWTEFARRRVELREGGGGDYLEGGVLHAEVKARMMVRADPPGGAITATMATDTRVRCRGRLWSIVSIADKSSHLAGSRRVLELSLDHGAAT